MRFYLIDRIEAWYPGERAEGVKCLTRADSFMEQCRVMPRSLLIESLAQLSSYLLGDSEGREGRRVLSLMTGVDTLSWHADIRPGDKVRLKAEILMRRPEGAKVAVEAWVGETCVAEGRLGFVFFAAESEAQAQEFSWTEAMLLRLTAECREGDPPRRAVASGGVL